MTIPSLNDLEDDADLDAAVALMVGLGEALDDLKRASAERMRTCREQLIALKLDPDEVLAAIDAEMVQEEDGGPVDEPHSPAEPAIAPAAPRRKRFGSMV